MQLFYEEQSRDGNLPFILELSNSHITQLFYEEQSRDGTFVIALEIGIVASRGCSMKNSRVTELLATGVLELSNSRVTQLFYEEQSRDGTFVIALEIRIVASRGCSMKNSRVTELLAT
ncbi:hypothetical protein JCGZ_14900 [Jatropha curcas]|uniref:Uncharacterized protein n=1 Tax=Jatropha curcas TaxID=180498 RepID=A0A067K7R7_JATCU|nr:hypothetical protein JCGZ_14900 [Jatropha curcas]